MAFISFISGLFGKPKIEDEADQAHRNRIADAVKQDLFEGISPEYQQFIFKLFDMGGGLNLKQNLERFRAFSQAKGRQYLNNETHEVVDRFYQRIKNEHMQTKLEALKNLETESPDLWKTFTKDEQNLIRAINHRH